MNQSETPRLAPYDMIFETGRLISGTEKEWVDHQNQPLPEGITPLLIDPFECDKDFNRSMFPPYDSGGARYASPLVPQPQVTTRV